MGNQEIRCVWAFGVKWRLRARLSVTNYYTWLSVVVVSAYGGCEVCDLEEPGGMMIDNRETQCID